MSDATRYLLMAWVFVDNVLIDREEEPRTVMGITWLGAGGPGFAR